MNEQTWRLLEAEFDRFPVLVAGSVSDEEIDAALSEVDVPCDPDYRAFLRRYGGAVVGAYPILGLRQAAPMGNDEWHVLRTTLSFREQRWRGVDDWLVISADHAGNPIGLRRDGSIWISDHDAGELQQLAASFEEFLVRKCLGRRWPPDLEQT